MYESTYSKFYFNEFVANDLRDNMGSKKSASNLRKKNKAVFSFDFPLYWDFGLRNFEQAIETINFIEFLRRKMN